MWHQTITVPPGNGAASLPSESVAFLFEQLPASDSTALPAAMLRLIEPVFPAQHCAVFSLRPKRPPRLACEASLSPRPFPVEVGLEYMHSWHRFDALSTFIDRRGASPGHLTLFQQGCHDIDNRNYLQNCYERCNVIDRLSILVPMAAEASRPSHWLAVNLYRVHGTAPFAQEESHAMLGVLAVLGAAAKLKYGALNPECTQADVCGIGRLSAREAQVTELVAAGHSSKEIAARLKIQPNTVVTLRKRAGEKLDASNGKALSARWAALTSPALSSFCPKYRGYTHTRSDD